MTLYLYTAETLEASLSHGAILCTQEQADEYYLMHYRTKGSKNGERRYQDEQGRLTPEGYRHYAEMYGWGSRLKKADKLQNDADQKRAKAESAARRSDEDVVNAYKANQKNERRTTDRRQMKADKANARSAESRAEAAKASLDARKAQDKATAYADKLARKVEKLSKYMNDDGTLNEEGLKKYTVPGATPGSHTMSLVGRLKFGKEISNRVNQQNRMTKAEYKDWEQKEKAEFGRNEQALSLLNKRVNEYDSLPSDGQARKAKLDSIVSQLDDIRDGHIKTDRHTEEDLEDWVKQKVDEDLQSVRKLRSDLGNYDAMSAGQRRKIGDQALEELAAQNRNYRDTSEFKDETNAIQDWLVDKVYEKSGSINAGDYKSGTNAAKAQEKVDETSRRMNEREDQVKKEINYQYDKSFGKKYQKEEARLRQVLQKDSVWKSLDIEWEKNQDDVMGAILKDLGFSDTPRNRSILYGYGWWD